MLIAFAYDLFISCFLSSLLHFSYFSQPIMSMTCSNYTSKFSHSVNKKFCISNIKCIWCNRIIEVMIKFNYLKLKQLNKMNRRKKYYINEKKQYFFIGFISGEEYLMCVTKYQTNGLKQRGHLKIYSTWTIWKLEVHILQEGSSVWIYGILWKKEQL